MSSSSLRRASHFPASSRLSKPLAFRRSLRNSRLNGSMSASPVGFSGRETSSATPAHESPSVQRSADELRPVVEPDRRWRPDFLRHAAPASRPRPALGRPIPRRSPANDARTRRRSSARGSCGRRTAAHERRPLPRLHPRRRRRIAPGAASLRDRPRRATPPLPPGAARRRCAAR